MAEISKEQWEEWAERLQDAFDPDDVTFRPGKGGMALAYADARTYAQRLDDVVGIGNWSFDWTPVYVSESGAMKIAKGTLTICGASKSDVGKESNIEGNLGIVSHCFKRACVQWGVGRYLYHEESEKVALDKDNKIPTAKLKALRDKLPRPKYPYSHSTAHQREEDFKFVDDPTTDAATDEWRKQEASAKTDTRATEAAQPIREVARTAGLISDESYQRAAKDYAGEHAKAPDYERVKDWIQRDIQARYLLKELGVTPAIYEAEREKRTGHKAPYNEKDLTIMEAWVRVMQKEADDALAAASFQDEPSGRQGSVAAPKPEKPAEDPGAMKPALERQIAGLKQLIVQLGENTHVIPENCTYGQAVLLLRTWSTEFDELRDARRKARISQTPTPVGVGVTPSEA